MDRFRAQVFLLHACAVGLVTTVVAAAANAQVHTPYCLQSFIYADGTCDPGLRYVPRCDAASFTRPRVVQASSTPFTMILASDTQLPWGTAPGCAGTTTECEIEYGTLTNRWHARAMNGIQSLGSWPGVLPNSGGQPISEPAGVIINGDLTAFFHYWQVDLYRKFYDPSFPGADPDVLQLPLYAGLGNHDYANNVNDCFGIEAQDWIDHGANSCAFQAARYVRAMLACGTVPSFPHRRVLSFDNSSLAYSWDMGSWHFVQLHNYPTYTVPDLGITSSIAWLANDLDEAAAAEKKVVLNLHDYSDHWSMNDPGFQAAISGSTVVAVFAGHYHSLDGLRTTVPGTSIPLFLSGAAEYNRFLLAEFGEDYLTVATISSLNGTPAFVTSSRSADLDSYSVPLPLPADTDGDGVNGGADNCPKDANSSQYDTDSDGIGDACDNCPLHSNEDQQDSDGDLDGDLCDTCPAVSNPGQSDPDADGIGDECDNCAADANSDQADADADAVGDVCDATPGLCPDSPSETCDAVTRAALAIKQDSDASRNQWKLTLAGATAREQAAFGNPMLSTYSLACLYYDGVLQASYRVPPSAALWKDSPPSKGWKYRDKARTSSGIESIKAKAGTASSPAAPSLVFKGKGATLPMPPLPVPGGVSSVRAQVINNAGATCWNADFAPPFRSNSSSVAGASLRTTR